MKHLNVVRVVLLLSLAGLAGCGLFSRERKEVYLQAEQGKTLDIPPDMDSPMRRNVMQIPSGTTSTEGVSEKPVSSIEGRSGEISEKLFINAGPDEAFERVRDALEQAQVGTLGKIDPANRTIAVKVEIESVEVRWLLRDRVKRRQLLRVARVVADGAKSRVLVADGNGEDVDDEGSKKILLAVRERVTD